MPDGDAWITWTLLIPGRGITLPHGCVFLNGTFYLIFWNMYNHDIGHQCGGQICKVLWALDNWGISYLAHDITTEQVTWQHHLCHQPHPSHEKLQSIAHHMLRGVILLKSREVLPWTCSWIQKMAHCKKYDGAISWSFGSKILHECVHQILLKSIWMTVFSFFISSNGMAWICFARTCSWNSGILNNTNVVHHSSQLAWSFSAYHFLVFPMSSNSLSHKTFDRRSFANIEKHIGCSGWRPWKTACASLRCMVR